MALADQTVTRFPNGVTNNADNAGFASLKVNDRSIYHEFIEDFDRYTATEWTTGGVGTPVAPLLVAGDGGRIQLTNSAANNDNNWLQQLVPAFTISAGKRLFFRARMSLNASTFGAVVAGLQVAVATNTILTPVNGLFLRKDSNSTGMSIVNRVGNVETASGNVGDYTGGAMADVFFAYDGASTVYAGSGSTVITAITPAAFTGASLGVVVGIQNTSAASRVLVVDQLFCAKER